jgi:multiple sugar transport system substrate-binding protein
MNQWIKVFLPLIVIAVLLCSSCQGTAETSSTGGDSSTDKVTSELPVNTDISGTVRYAVRDTVADQTDELLESFKIMYPNINVELEIFSGDLNTALSAWATAKNMPDVVLGWDNLSFFALQGWLYPLDEFLDKDPEKEYIHKTSLEGFRYEGKTYAVPAWLQFSTIVVNLDLIETLNMDKPDYDWTIDEFINMAKKATTTQYSGINHVESLEQYLMEQMLKTGHQWGYHPETKTFNLSDGAFVNAVKTVNDLLAYPQLVADALRNNDIVSAGGQDDYAKKFGAGADGLSGGRILFANQSTWDDEWMASQFKFKWDYYPIPAPTKEESKQVVHADYGMMLSTAKEPQAAFELLKFFTYGKDGLLVRMEQQNTSDVLTSRFTIPPNTHPDVSAKFNASKNVPDGVKYMYNHMDKSVKGDYSKVLPDYWKVVNDNIWSAKERISKGEDPAAVAKEVEKKINEEFTKTYQDFSAKMKTIQQEFDAAHKQ